MGQRGKRVDPDEIESMCQWYMRGAGIREISRMFDRGRNTVRRLVRQADSTNGSGKKGARRKKST